MNRYLSIFSSLLLFLLILITLSCCTKDEKETTRLNIYPPSVEFGTDGGTIEIHISSNTSWIIINPSEWCRLPVEGAEGDGILQLTADSNQSENERTATILFKADNISKELQVLQRGSSDTVPEFSYDIPPDATNMRDMTSVELAAEMGVGWNVGNSLEAIGGETAWGNPLITKTLIDSVKAAGFTSMRIPVAWSKFSDESTFTIDVSWMDRVEEVVNYVLDDDMYAVMNIHWDGGWMQPTYADEAYVNARLEAMWDQIATRFRDYDDHLLFAGTNEVMVEGDYGTPTPEYYTVQNGFNRTFVTTVRKTGGRNAYRHLVVQGFNTNINNTLSFAEIPEDVTPDRLMMEVHYYDPYNFTINENSSITQWGMYATDPAHTETWANESYADDQFQKMKTNFIDKGIAVILGEYGVLSRLNVEDHAEYRRYYIEYVTHSMVHHGLVPFLWDNGYTGNHGMGIFDRHTGEQVYPELVEAIVTALPEKNLINPVSPYTQ